MTIFSSSKPKPDPNSSKSHTSIHQIKLSHTWIISQFSRSHKSGRVLKSALFASEEDPDCQFYLELSFKRPLVSKYTHIGLRLFRVSGGGKLVVSCEFSILDENGNKQNRFEFTAKHAGSKTGVGTAEFVSRKILFGLVKPLDEEMVNLLPNDQLTIRAELSYETHITKKLEVSKEIEKRAEPEKEEKNQIRGETESNKKRSIWRRILQNLCKWTCFPCCCWRPERS